jgi:hypothetical protein
MPRRREGALATSAARLLDTRSQGHMPTLCVLRGGIASPVWQNHHVARTHAPSRQDFGSRSAYDMAPQCRGCMDAPFKLANHVPVNVPGFLPNGHFFNDVSDFTGLYLCFGNRISPCAYLGRRSENINRRLAERGALQGLLLGTARARESTND